MGARPSQFRKGGGRLNGVDVTITGIEWTGDELVYTKGQSGFERVEFKAGKVKGADGKIKEKFHTLNALVSFMVDGATEATVEPMFAGGADDFAIGEGGLSIWDAAYDTEDAAIEASEDPNNKVKGLGANTKFFYFIESLVNAGFPDSNLPEDRICYEAVHGTRVRLIQREDPAMKGKKRIDKATKKEYAYTYTAVDDVLALPEATEAPAAPVAKAGAKVAPKAAVKASAVKVFDVDEAASTDLAALLAVKSPLTVKELDMLVLKRGMALKRPQDQTQAIRTRILQADFLNAQSVGAYNKAAKTVERVGEEVKA